MHIAKKSEDYTQNICIITSVKFQNNWHKTVRGDT